AGGLDDRGYLDGLASERGAVLEAARTELVVYVAGADSYAGDRLGRVARSIEGLRRRDREVFEGCRRRGLPVAMVLGGGYARDLIDLVTIHANTVRELLAQYA